MPKVIVAGASGLVGYAALEAFANPDIGGSLDVWEVVGVSRRPASPPIPGTTYEALDLDDREACRAFSRRHADVTHIVFAALFEKPGLVRGWRERDQMERNLSMLANFFEPLAQAPNLQHVSLLQGTKAYGAHVEPIAVPARERWPRHPHDNFYWLQEDYLRGLQKPAGWTLTIFRPQVVFGRALGANMNPIPALGVYAALLKSVGEPLYFPASGVPFVFEGVDSDLLGRALVWAAVTPVAANQTFNVTNGDVMVWINVWPAIADALGMQPGPVRPVSLATDVRSREREWLAIVKSHDLVVPPSLDAFVGQSLEYVDFLMMAGATTTPPPAIVSTIKIREAGFHQCMDSEDMLRKWLRRFQDERLLPPR
jgi:nucleoside-diphosphate-sugar epimerase